MHPKYMAHRQTDRWMPFSAPCHIQAWTKLLKFPPIPCSATPLLFFDKGLLYLRIQHGLAWNGRKPYPTVSASGTHVGGVSLDVSKGTTYRRQRFPRQSVPRCTSWLPRRFVSPGRRTRRCCSGHSRHAGESRPSIRTCSRRAASSRDCRKRILSRVRGGNRGSSIE
jgi:hypothetical protein